MYVCEQVFPRRNVEVNTPGRWATPADSCFQWFQNNICTTNEGIITRIPDFQIKYISYIVEIDHEKDLSVKKIKYKYIHRHLCQI